MSKFKIYDKVQVVNTTPIGTITHVQRKLYTTELEYEVTFSDGSGVDIWWNEKDLRLGYTPDQEKQTLSFRTIKGLREEVAELTERNRALHARQHDYETLKAENTRLKAVEQDNARRLKEHQDTINHMVGAEDFQDLWNMHARQMKTIVRLKREAAEREEDLDDAFAEGFARGEEEAAEDDQENDGTDAAHPAWWRGQETGTNHTAERLLHIVKHGMDGGQFADGPLADCAREICGLRAEYRACQEVLKRSKDLTESLKQKLESAYALVPPQPGDKVMIDVVDQIGFGLHVGDVVTTVAIQASRGAQPGWWLLTFATGGGHTMAAVKCHVIERAA